MVSTKLLWARLGLGPHRVGHPLDSCHGRRSGRPGSDPVRYRERRTELVSHSDRCHPFLIFIIAGIAELNHPPFDLVEAEQEIVGASTPNTRPFDSHSSSWPTRELITMGALIVTLFLGGPAGLPCSCPRAGGSGFWFFFKLMFFLFGLVWVRATLPRFRYDQLMDFGWKLLIPLSLAWFILLAASRSVVTTGGVPCSSLASSSDCSSPVPCSPAC